MRAWYFTEQPYAEAWDTAGEYMKIDIPAESFDPEIASGLLNRYLDEYVIADELGLDIMVNEHHSTYSCMSPSPTLPLAILARQTKNARLLTLGCPLGNRLDPFRLAEELALIDLISGGRLEMGFVKGSGWEIYSTNVNPGRYMERFWESHDLILKALTTRDGPFSWEGDHFHYRAVNVQPRCLQQPHPPIWMTATSPFSAEQIAAKGYVMASPMLGKHVVNTFAAYRNKYFETFGKPAANDRLGYLALAAVGNNETEARKRGEKVARHLSTQHAIYPGYINPPGYTPVPGNVAMLKRKGSIAYPDTLEGLAEEGIVFWGTPDQVYEQITSFYQRAGGFGHIMLEGQAYLLDHEETVDSLTLFSREVLPRLKEFNAQKERDNDWMEKMSRPAY